jgi:rubredoxin
VNGPRHARGTAPKAPALPGLFFRPRGLPSAPAISLPSITDPSPDGHCDMSEPLRTWMCLICGWIYDEKEGLPDEGIAPGTRWDDIPPNWTCPECGARKEDFEMVEV